MPDHKIIDPVRLDPIDRDGIVAPKKILNYALALGLGLIIPFLFLIIRNLLNTRIYDIEDVTRTVNYPVVGLIPQYKKNKRQPKSNYVVLNDHSSQILESFRSLRSNLLFLIPEKKTKLIVITSTRGEEGKTFTALNLAASFSLLNRKTIYIDADIRKPSILFNDNIQIDKGLSNYLAGQLIQDEIINQSGQNPNLYLIPSGTIQSNSSELLESKAMELLIDKLDFFEYVIIDTPPVGLVADAMPLLGLADLTLYIVRHGISRHSDLEFLRDFTKNAGLKNIVVSINRINNSSGYGYGYGLGYGLGYEKK